MIPQESNSLAILNQSSKYLVKTKDIDIYNYDTDILIVFKANENVHDKQLQIVLKTKLLACPFNDNASCKAIRYQSNFVCLFVP